MLISDEPERFEKDWCSEPMSDDEIIAIVADNFRLLDEEEAEAEAKQKAAHTNNPTIIDHQP